LLAQTSDDAAAPGHGAFAVFVVVGLAAARCSGLICAKAAVENPKAKARTTKRSIGIVSPISFGEISPGGDVVEEWMF
jgi:hypothetical protein